MDEIFYMINILWCSISKMEKKKKTTIMKWYWIDGGDQWCNYNFKREWLNKILMHPNKKI